MQNKVEIKRNNIIYLDNYENDLLNNTLKKINGILRISDLTYEEQEIIDLVIMNTEI